MVAKRGLGPEALDPVLEALLTELEAATKESASGDAAGSERRAKTLAALSKVAESLSSLLNERQARIMEREPERSAQESAAQARDAEVWRAIEGRLARIHAAQDAAADCETARSGEAGEASS